MSRRITPLGDLRSLGSLVGVLRRTRPDVVHGHTPKGGLLAMLAAWLCRVRVRVYHLHGLPMVTATGLKRQLLRWCEKVSCGLAHRVFCVSPSLREVALAEGLCGPDKITVLVNGTIDGVDAAGEFNPTGLGPGVRDAVRKEHGIPPGALVVGFVGRLVRDKGVTELAQAWKVLSAKFPELHLLIVGPLEPHDPLAPEMLNLLRADRVLWVGEVPIEGMPRLYCAMDVLVLPTYREGFPTVLLEAAAMELPVVATRIPGCVDAVRDGETGKLVPARDAVALAEALSAYLRDSALRRQHGTAGRARVLRVFQPQALAEALYREYVRLLHDEGLCECVAGAGTVSGTDTHLAPSPNGQLLTRATPSTFYRRRGKRLFDSVVSAATLVGLTPVLLLLAFLVRCFLGAPVLFRQKRSGRGQRPFTLVKFRTMTDACDTAGQLLPDSQRLTRFGRLLRSTSLDELPELWNVLKGDMSLVGPRPLLPRYDPYYSHQELRRFDLLPGLTGWAQINGRNDLAWDDRLACDVWYAGACSFGLDLKILFRTVIKVLRWANVQADPGATFGALDAERPRRIPQRGEVSEGV
jgi:lipopolysaccharide/colanic/teichoic acid biosynthesis glycosyltransferase/glycosyltransferase involved in cell wall biosynthesis